MVENVLTSGRFHTPSHGAQEEKGGDGAIAHKNPASFRALEEDAVAFSLIGESWDSVLHAMSPETFVPLTENAMKSTKSPYYQAKPVGILESFKLKARVVPNVYTYNEATRVFAFDMSVRNTRVQRKFMIPKGAPIHLTFSYDAHPSASWGINWGSRVVVQFKSGAKPQFIWIPGIWTYDPSNYSRVYIQEEECKVLTGCILALVAALSLGCSTNQLELIHEGMTEICAKSVRRPTFVQWLYQQVHAIYLHSAIKPWPEYLEEHMKDLPAHAVKYLESYKTGFSIPPSKFFDDLYSKEGPRMPEEKEAFLRKFTGRVIMFKIANVDPVSAEKLRQTPMTDMPELHHACFARDRKLIHNAIALHGGIDVVNVLGDSALHVLIGVLGELPDSPYEMVGGCLSNTTIWFELADIVLTELLAKHIDTTVVDRMGRTPEALIEFEVIYPKIYKNSLFENTSETLVKQLKELGKMKVLASSQPTLACLKVSAFLDDVRQGSLYAEELCELSTWFSRKAAIAAGARMMPTNDAEEQYMAIADKCMGSNKWGFVNILAANREGETALKYAIETKNTEFLKSKTMPSLLEHLWNGYDVRLDNNPEDFQGDGEETMKLPSLKELFNKATYSLCVPRIKWLLDAISDASLALIVSSNSYLNPCDSNWVDKTLTCSFHGTSMEFFVLMLVIGKIIRELQELQEVDYDLREYIRDTSNHIDISIMVTIMLYQMMRVYLVLNGNELHSSDDGPEDNIVHLISIIIFDLSILVGLVLIWARVLLIFSLSASVGPLLITVTQMLVTLGRYTIISGVVICGTTFGFMSFLSEDDQSQAEQWQSSGRGLVFMISSFLGDFDFDAFSKLSDIKVFCLEDCDSVGSTVQLAASGKQVVAELTYGIFLLLCTILLINLLIAIFTSLYVSVEESRMDVHRLTRAETCLFYERNKLVLPNPLNLFFFASYAMGLVFQLHRCGKMGQPDGWLCSSCFETHLETTESYCINCGRSGTQLRGSERLAANTARLVYGIAATTFILPLMVLYTMYTVVAHKIRVAFCNGLSVKAELALLHKHVKGSSGRHVSTTSSEIRELTEIAGDTEVYRMNRKKIMGTVATSGKAVQGGDNDSGDGGGSNAGGGS